MCKTRMCLNLCFVLELEKHIFKGEKFNRACAHASSQHFATQSSLLCTDLGGKPKWLPLNSGYHDVMRTTPIVFFEVCSEFNLQFLVGVWRLVAVLLQDIHEHVHNLSHRVEKNSSDSKSQGRFCFCSFTDEAIIGLARDDVNAFARGILTYRNTERALSAVEIGSEH